MFVLQKDRECGELPNIKTCIANSLPCSSSLSMHISTWRRHVRWSYTYTQSEGPQRMHQNENQYKVTDLLHLGLVACEKKDQWKCKKAVRTDECMWAVAICVIARLRLCVPYPFFTIDETRTHGVHRWCARPQYSRPPSVQFMHARSNIIFLI